MTDPRPLPPFYDIDFVNPPQNSNLTARAQSRQANRRTEYARRKRALGYPPDGNHGASAYANYGCRCTTCRIGRREWNRRKRNAEPSLLAKEVDRLNNELDAAEMNLNALREENAMLRCRLQELGE